MVMRSYVAKPARARDLPVNGHRMNGSSGTQQTVPPPPPPSLGMASSLGRKGAAERTASSSGGAKAVNGDEPFDWDRLLGEVRGGVRLRHTETNDRSSPIGVGRVRSNGLAADTGSIPKPPMLIDSLQRPERQTRTPEPPPSSGQLRNADLFDRDRLLNEVRSGLTLRRVTTNDRSAPIGVGKVRGDVTAVPSNSRPTIQSVHVPPPPPPPSSALSAPNASIRPASPRSTKVVTNPALKKLGGSEPFERDRLLASIREGIPLRKVEMHDCSSAINVGRVRDLPETERSAPTRSCNPINKSPPAASVLPPPPPPSASFPQVTSNSSRQRTGPTKPTLLKLGGNPTFDRDELLRSIRAGVKLRKTVLSNDCSSAIINDDDSGVVKSSGRSTPSTSNDYDDAYGSSISDLDSLGDTSRFSSLSNILERPVATTDSGASRVPEAEIPAGTASDRIKLFDGRTSNSSNGRQTSRNKTHVTNHEIIGDSGESSIKKMVRKFSTEDASKTSHPIWLPKKVDNNDAARAEVTSAPSKSYSSPSSQPRTAVAKPDRVVRDEKAKKPGRVKKPSWVNENAQPGNPSEINKKNIHDSTKSGAVRGLKQTAQSPSANIESNRSPELKSDHRITTGNDGGFYTAIRVEAYDDSTLSSSPSSPPPLPATSPPKVSSPEIQHPSSNHGPGQYRYTPRSSRLSPSEPPTRTVDDVKTDSSGTRFRNNLLNSTPKPFSSSLTTTGKTSVIDGPSSSLNGVDTQKHPKGSSVCVGRGRKLVINTDESAQSSNADIASDKRSYPNDVDRAGVRVYAVPISAPWYKPDLYRGDAGYGRENVNVTACGGSARRLEVCSQASLGRQGLGRAHRVVVGDPEIELVYSSHQAHFESNSPEIFRENYRFEIDIDNEQQPLKIVQRW